jgi:transposase
VNNDYKEFLCNIKILKEQLESGNAPNKFLINNYSKYLIINNSSKKGVRVAFDNDQILKYQKKYCGFFCLLSPNIKEAIEALKIYRNRDKVEKCFDDLKNTVDSRRLRVHTSERLDARIFIQFLSLIYASKIRALLLEDSKASIKHLSLDEIFDDLKILTQTQIKEKYGKLYCEADKETNKILDCFGLRWPPL